MDLESLPWYGQLGVFLVVGAILFGFFYFIIYSPKADDVTRIQNESAELDKQIRIAERNEGRLQKLEEERKYKENILDQLKAILPEKKEVDTMVRKIQSLASTARLRVNDIKPQTSKQLEIYEEWPTEYTMEGNYHNLAIFFDQLSRQAKIYNVDLLTINPMTAMTDEYTVRAKFTAITYIYHEIEIAKPKPKPHERPKAVADEKSLGESGGVQP